MFIFLPISHEQQTVQRLPWITFGLIALNVIVFFLTTAGRTDTEDLMHEKSDQFLRYYVTHPYLKFPEQMRTFLSEGDNERIDILADSAETTVDSLTREREQEELDTLADDFIQAINSHPFRQYGYIPAKPKMFNLISCMFLHDGFWHLFGNMLFLFLAGCAIEDIWGRPLYIAFYLIGGIVATFTFQFSNSASMVPLVGASGAIAGLMGAFLVRLAQTRIRFFYIIFLLFFGFRTGTFLAPAYIVLPLWLLQQITYAWMYEGQGGVAFSAHIGGFGFGAAFAFIMKLTQLEEKYIAPSIEKKVSLEQNPLFLKGVQLSENKDYPGALIHLQKVVRADPNHFEAFMEMRRIAEITGDRKGYNRNMAGIFDLLLRNRDYDLFIDLYTQYKDHPFRDVLPARTLMAVGLFFEEQGDTAAAVSNLEALVENYIADPLSMKGYSRLARIYLEKFEDRTKALAAFREAYFHPQSSQDWRSALAMELKKYGWTPDDLGRVSLKTAKATLDEIESIAKSNVERVAVVSAAQVSSPQMVQAMPKVAVQAGSEPMMIPSINFDGAHHDWNVVQCRIEKISLKGIILSNHSKVGQLPWKRIRLISVASLKDLQPGRSLVLDLIAQSNADPAKIIYRVLGSDLNFEKIFPRVEQTFDEAYQNFIGIVIRNSGARCVPDRTRVTGPHFPAFPSVEDYDAYLQQQSI